MKKRHNRINPVKVVILVFTVSVFVIGAFLAFHFWESKTNDQEYIDPLNEISEMNDENRNIVRYKGKWFEEDKSLETFLLIGVDKYKDDENLFDEDEYLNSQQSDFLLLLIIDKENNCVTPLQINRDTMAEVNIIGDHGEDLGFHVEQLALSHTYGQGGKDSCRNTVRAVQNLLYNVEIDHYAALTMDAVQIINDLIGGVTVTIKDDFSNTTDKFVIGEEVTLHGSDALLFVRSRMSMGDPTNINRMERQKEYLSKLVTGLIQASQADKDFSFKMAMAVNDYMVSDCTVSQLSDLGNLLPNCEISEFQNIAGEATLGERYIEFIPDEQALQEQVISIFFKETENGK